MMEVHEDGKSVVSTGSARGDGARRAGHARVRPLGDDGQVRVSGFHRHRRSKLIIANFTGFEADLLRSLACQLVELLRNEAAVPARRRGPVRGDDGLLRSDPGARGPGAGPAVPDRLPRRRGGGRRVPPVHRGRAARRQGRRRGRDHRRPRGGRAPAGAHRGRADDRRRARRAGRRGLDAVLHRPAARARHPARRSRRATRTTGTRCPRRTPVRRRTTSTSGWATCRRPWWRRLRA